ncbi:transmembrane and coiled-coil domain-containing protein 5B-like [Pituophis catenifer annectens]|uniref:transmembrane and coiled-coil domain-containing protein 5B-like n=1 Tax=Pituophis catenifer annectens TaxID=94852 RepID=UPI00399635BF
MSLEDLSASNRNLRLQVEELRENIASLDSENQEFLRDKEYIKEQHKCLRETVNHLKSSMEHLQKTVEDFRESLDHVNMAIHELALQNKSLVKANNDLNQEMHEVTSQVAVYKNDKPTHENDLKEMQNLPSEVHKYLRNLEDKLSEMEHNYCVEKTQSGQLKEKVTAIQRAREHLRNRIKDLQNQQDLCVQQATFMRLDQENQVPTGILMHELVEARLVGVARDGSKERKFLRWLWVAAKMLMMLLFGCCLIFGLVLAYTHFFNPLFISETLVVLLSDQSIEKLVHHFSPYLVQRNDGLLPF